jgi:hypothetical protein
MNEDSKEIGILAVDDHPLLPQWIAGLIAAKQLGINPKKFS